MIESTVFIGAVIVGFTQFVRLILDKKYDRAIIIVFAVLTGVLVALFDTQLSIASISVAQGILIGLAAPGVVTVASKIGGK